MTTVLAELEIPTTDGRALGACWFEALGRPRGVVVLAPAMATEATYYRHLAAWLRDRGLSVLLFDYTGYGWSSTGPLAEVEADAMRWMLDARDAGSYALERADGLPVTWVGHSLGGQALGLATHERFAGAVLISSGTGTWRYNAPKVRWQAPLLWKAIAPVAIGVSGYFPGKRLGVLGDLPPGVMRQWGRWCMKRDYLWTDFPELVAAYEAVTTPTVSLSFTDDELLADRSFRDLADRLPNAVVEVVRADPRDHGLRSIGHHGFFRKERADLWESLLLPHLATLPS
ncbi:alpha/beta fold hydrolase [Mumia zhuanghuii]|uniref:Alpha/beta fold hydrolase n=2 Tax=Mumia TaxID=1546255 RepID=A0ABW1QMR1_9ACTN|nr:MULTISPECIES: alpha/beta fold hydrolase [Mumia]KAA1419859.1 alpha/beta fold hydrolase [Mumia zhuanghuii]